MSTHFTPSPQLTCLPTLATTSGWATIAATPTLEGTASSPTRTLGTGISGMQRLRIEKRENNDLVELSVEERQGMKMFKVAMKLLCEW